MSQKIRGAITSEIAINLPDNTVGEITAADVRGVLNDINDSCFNLLSDVPIRIDQGGTGQITANNALNAFLPSQAGNNGKVLSTNGTDTSWQTATGGGTIGGSIANKQVAIGNGTNTIAGSSAVTYDGTTFQIDTGSIIKGQYSNLGHTAYINPDGSAVFGAGGVVISNVGAVTGGTYNGNTIGSGTTSGANSGDQIVPVNTAAIASNFFTAYNSSTGAFTKAQPAFTDISGTAAAAQLPVATTGAFGAVKPDGTTITISAGVISSVGGGSGTVTTTGTPATGNLTKFSGGTSITNGDLSGDITTSGTLATTLATVNSNTGSFGSSTAIPNFTVNGKGLITAAGSNAVIAPAGTLTGTTLASNVVTSSLTSLGSQSADLNLNSHKLINVTDPTSAQDAATKSYVDTAVTGLLDYRGSYNASTNLFPATGGSGVLGAVLKADFWICSVTGTLGGTAVTPGDLIIALVDTPGQTAANWDLIPHDLGSYVTSVSNSDGTLTISPTTGNVTASLALGHANAWSGQQTFVAPVLGTPASGVMTNVTGTAAGLTSGITNALKSATTTVDVSAATAPTSGQVLTATGGTAATWQTPAGGGSGTVTTTGTPASGNLSFFSGGTSITNGDLTSDVTTSGTSATTVAAIQGTAVTGTTGTGRVVFQTAPTIFNMFAFASSLSAAPLNITGKRTSGVTSGDIQQDGSGLYGTIDTSSGVGSLCTQQYFRLTSTGSTISTIANYFGTTSNITLVSGGYYEIEIEAYYLKTIGGTVTWTFTNSAAPTAMNMDYIFSPVGGVGGTPTNNMLFGQQYDITSATPTVVTGTLSSAANHYNKFKIFLINSTGTSLKIQATCSAGSITPGIGSYWKCRRLPASSTGTFAA